MQARWPPWLPLTISALKPWLPQGAGRRRLALAGTLSWTQAAPVWLVLGPHFFLPECGLGGGDFLSTGDAAAAAGDSHLGRPWLLQGRVVSMQAGKHPARASAWVWAARVPGYQGQLQCQRPRCQEARFCTETSRLGWKLSFFCSPSQHPKPLGMQNGSLEPRWEPKLQLVLPQGTAFVYEVLSQSIQRTVTPHCKPMAPAHAPDPSSCPPRHWGACS